MAFSHFHQMEILVQRFERATEARDRSDQTKLHELINGNQTESGRGFTSGGFYFTIGDGFLLKATESGTAAGVYICAKQGCKSQEIRGGCYCKEHLPRHQAVLEPKDGIRQQSIKRFTNRISSSSESSEPAKGTSRPNQAFRFQSIYNTSSDSSVHMNPVRSDGKDKPQFSPLGKLSTRFAKSHNRNIPVIEESESEKEKEESEIEYVHVGKEFGPAVIDQPRLNKDVGGAASLRDPPISSEDDDDEINFEMDCNPVEEELCPAVNDQPRLNEVEGVGNATSIHHPSNSREDDDDELSSVMDSLSLKRSGEDSHIPNPKAPRLETGNNIPIPLRSHTDTQFLDFLRDIDQEESDPFASDKMT